MTNEKTFSRAVRASWIKPAVRTIRAGDAENSPNPRAGDGRFSSGS